MAGFKAELFRVGEPGGWYFVRIPDDHAPDEAGAWGRSPILATVEGQRWTTSAWRDTQRGWLLAVPKRIRGSLEEGDTVHVEIEPDPERL